ncbi:inclusion body family protein [Pseudoalteromonas luteoviolacea]|nr:inclusion body family protein [Pseudoalteromonas luteoviolacea]
MSIVTNVQIVIDTALVLKDHPTPSQEPNNPTL